MKTILVDAVHTLVNENGELDRELYQLLEEYSNDKIVVTNAEALGDVPYPVYTLRRDPPKTDPAYFRCLLADYDLSPDDVVYFEHNPGVVETARLLGIRTYRFDPQARNLSALRSFLNTNAHRTDS